VKLFFYSCFTEQKHILGAHWETKKVESV
jgi:hypothetical protein